MYESNLIKIRILLTGANGMLGQRTAELYLARDKIELLAASIEDNSITKGIDYVSCDIANREQMKKIIYDFCPDFIINAAAFTNVDLSETSREDAWKTNVKAVEYLTEAARVIDAHLIHVSSDYIFDGKEGPYDENATPNPIGYYGRTKLASENVLKIGGVIHTIVRTNVLYGFVENSRPDFVRWLITELKNGKTVKIVDDQINNPTFIEDLVQGINKIIEFKKQGVYNIGGKEFLSRFDFANKIAEFFNLDTNLIKKIKTSELNQRAKRPLNSGLITLKAETELAYKPHTISESLSVMKKEIYI
ncbi:MAG: SDR family oxidoreductase [Ignavibacteria bacterium]|nr:SDR family oxidoreductase [Ignavibacteria bacterium]MBT8381227.1 SDR family oxidoreductase [Ignavibacteria bacterium]MBT8392117.1 SDR family oxidoreductase [Ignavibacteria bacterium]NNJ53904.1 SDR family oxidoreductase [Ignavibacteriaceae bacterium]NNL22641.1 SDR family oxidoreductase [Ignavibacteriaceae bacterium]